MSYTKIVLVICYLFGLHTHFDIVYHGHLICTSVGVGIPGLILLYMNRRRITWPRDAILVAAIPAIGVISILLSPDVGRLWQHGIRSLLQLSYSLVMGYSLYLEVSRWSAKSISKLFGIWLTIMTVGCLLEVHTPFKQVSDAYRHIVYYQDLQAGQDIYDSGSEVVNNRDLEIASHIRPTFFCQEPSYVAISVLFYLVVWYKTTKFKYATLLYFICLGINVYTIRSPILIGAVPIWLVSRAFSLKQWAAFSVVGAIALVICSSLFVDRIGNDNSLDVRLNIPYTLAYETIQDYPISGVGLGLIEVYEQEVYRLLLNYGLPIDFISSNIPITVAICNAFCCMIIYFGVGLTLLILLNIRSLIRVFGDRQYLFVGVAMFFLGNSYGSFVQPTLWPQLFMLMAATYLTSGRNYELAGDTSDLRNPDDSRTLHVSSRLVPSVGGVIQLPSL